MPNSDTKENVLETLRARLRSEPRLGPSFRPDELGLDDAGGLTLAGEVSSVAAKKRALEIAAAFDTVTAIVDRLHVVPASRMGDAEIRSHLRDFFALEPAFSGYAIRQLKSETYTPGFQQVYEAIAGDPATARGQIDIEVRDGSVTLNGHVPGLTSKRLAGVMAWWVPGVRDVVNGLEVVPPEEDAPIRIEDAVRYVLERNPYVDAGQIRVGVRIRDVRLTGFVRGEAERDMAERDAWCVFGVDSVINEIAVQP